MTLTRLLVLSVLLAVCAASPFAKKRTTRRESYGECSTTQMPKDFDLTKFADKTWYEISRLRNEFEENADCVRLDFFISGTEVNLGFTAHFINYTEGVMFGEGVMDVSGNETNIQMTFPGDDKQHKLTVLSTDFDNYAILYSCLQLTVDDPFGTKEERAWVLSRKPYFDKPIQAMVDEVLGNLPEDFTIFLDDVNTFCKPGC